MSVLRLFCVAGVLLSIIGTVSAQQRAGAQGEAAGQSPAAPAGNVEHGRYIVERVVMCYECHSGRDARGNILPQERFMGGVIPIHPAWGNDWATRAPRIAGLPGYTQEQAMRLLTQGAIGRDGTQLRAPMPRLRMTPQDAADVIAYLKSL